MGFPGSSDIKESSCNAGDPGSMPGSGRSTGERNGTYQVPYFTIHGKFQGEVDYVCFLN